MIKIVHYKMMAFICCFLLNTLYAKKPILCLAALTGENAPKLQEDFFLEKDIKRSEPVQGEKEQKQTSEQAAVEEQESSQQALHNKPIPQQATEYKEIPLPGLPEYTPSKAAVRISQEQPDEYLQQQQYTPEQPVVDILGPTPEELANKKEAEEVQKLVDTVDRILTQYSITIRDSTIGPEGITQDNYKKVTKFLEGMNNALAQNSVFDVKDTVLHAYEQYATTIKPKDFGTKNSASTQAWGAMIQRLKDQKLLE